MSWKNKCAVTLGNAHVELRRILPGDRDQLSIVAFDPEIWRYFVFRVSNQAELDQFIADAVNDTESGTRAVFCIVQKQNGTIAGSMAYGNMAEKEKRLEIGWSWLGKEFRGAGLNRWAKFLLLQHAFEVLGCERVEFKTDVLNVQARKGLQNIGAIEEGVLRSYNFMPDNRRRNAVYYSILKEEWPFVKESLLNQPKVLRRP
jgi:RimJ/RimL family protein N-acetyltransferase